MHVFPKKVLLINHLESDYNRSMSDGISIALRSAWGCEVSTIFQCFDLATIKSIVLHNNIDTIFGVNFMRPSNLWSLKVQWISWVQDYFPNSKIPELHHNDFVFLMAEKNALGFSASISPDKLGYLAMGIFSDRQYYPNASLVSPEHDFSIVGFIPAYERRSLKPQSQNEYFLNQIYTALMRYRVLRPVLKRRYRQLSEANLDSLEDIFFREAEKIAEAFFKPLKGTYDTKGLYNSVLELHDYYFPETVLRRGVNAVKSAAVDALIRTHYPSSFGVGRTRANFFAREYPRLLERVYLAKKMISVSEKSAFFGANWDTMPETKNYAFPPVSEKESFKIFKKTKVNVCNNNHGVSVHSRLLNCMASGGFVVSHDSPHDGLESIGLLSSFVPDEHFAFVDLENITEQLKFWKNNDHERRKISNQARKFVFAHHTWESRGLYIKRELN